MKRTTAELMLEWAKTQAPATLADYNLRMKLTEAQRRALPDKDFAIPERRAYPITDEEHARYALQDAAGHSLADQTRVRNAVRKRFPLMRVTAPKKYKTLVKARA